MIQITSAQMAKAALLEGEVLVYKPHGEQVTFLSLKSQYRITKFTMNVRYNISFDELGEILETNNVYIFEKDDDLEINQEFKKLIQ